MININRNKDKWHYNLIKEWNRLENGFKRKIYPVLTKQAYAAISDIKQGITNFEKYIYDYKPEIKKLLKSYYYRLAAIFYKKTEKIAGDLKSSSTVFLKDSEYIFWATMDYWINYEAAEHVVMINNTTRKLLKTQLKKGIKEGLTYEELGKKMDGMVPPLYARRSLTIAKTETHLLYNKTVKESVKSLKVPVKTRSWFAAGDERTRIEHASADGETVGMNEPFTMTGESLDYPGDPAGSAWNVIQCRCAVLYNTE